MLGENRSIEKRRSVFHSVLYTRYIFDVLLEVSQYLLADIKALQCMAGFGSVERLDIIRIRQPRISVLC